GREDGGGGGGRGDEREEATKAEAISFGAYRCLRNLYPGGSLPPPPAQPSVRLNDVLLSKGYSLAETCNTDDDCRRSDPTTPAGIGNIPAQAVIGARRPHRPTPEAARDCAHVP